MKHHKSVHAIILFKGKYFIQKRDNKKKIFIFQIFGVCFGGKIKNNELKIDAIIREIKEETNLKINKPKKKFKFHNPW